MLRRIQQERASTPMAAGQRHARSCHKGDDTTLSAAKGLPCVLAQNSEPQQYLTDNRSATNAIGFASSESYDRSDLWQRECSVKPFDPLRKLLRVASDVSGGAIDIASGNSGVFSSLEPDGFGVNSAGGLTEVLRPEGGNEAKDTSFKWNGLCVYDGTVGDGQKRHGDSDDELTLGNLKKIDDFLTDLREKASTSIPRYSPNRAKIAAARIDAILMALVADDMPSGGGGGRGIGSRGGAEERRGSETSPALSLADVEAVIAYVDLDQSGEIDLKELEVAISAAKQGKLKDTQMMRCMLKIDEEMHLQRLRIYDMFGRLDDDGSGALSCEELMEGLSTLCGHDRVKIIQRRQALRQRKMEQKVQEGRKRAHVMSFLSNLESLSGEVMQDREYFFADVIDNKAMDAIVPRISDQASDDDSEGGGSSSGDNADRNAGHSRRNPLPTTAKGLRAVEAQLDRLKESSLSRSSAEAAAVTMQQLHPGIPEEAAAAAENEAIRNRGAVQSTKILGRGRSAAISAAAAALAKSAARMSRKQRLTRSNNAGKGKIGWSRGVESNFHLWLSDAEDVGSSARSMATATMAADGAGEERLRVAPMMLQEEVMEMQKSYNLKDRYLRVYLQRRFESERLPRLFSARSKSRVHGYAVNDAFEMARKQAARMPPLL